MIFSLVTSPSSIYHNLKTLGKVPELFFIVF
jgi:hypothetical protein